MNHHHHLWGTFCISLIIWSKRRVRMRAYLAPQNIAYHLCTYIIEATSSWSVAPLACSIIRLRLLIRCLEHTHACVSDATRDFLPSEPNNPFSNDCCLLFDIIWFAIYRVYAHIFHLLLHNWVSKLIPCFDEVFFSALFFDFLFSSMYVIFAIVVWM